MPYICINANPIPGNYDLWLSELEEGKEYNGYINEYGADKNGNISPCLVIPMITEDHGFDIQRFIEISDLDETTLVTEEFEEKYSVTVTL